MAHPDEPWLRRADWASGRIAGASRRAVLAAWAFALAWWALSAPILLLVPSRVAANRTALIAFVFPLAGVWLVARAIRLSLELARYGTPLFRMAAVPGSLGGDLVGAIEARFAAPPAEGVTLKLTCIRRTVSGGGRSRSVWENIVWRDERVVGPTEIGPAPTGMTIPVRFALPLDQPPTNADNPNDAIVWRLDATARVPGLDFEAQFEVPVFRTAASPSATPAAAEAARGPGGAPTRPARSQTVVRPTAGGGTEFLFPKDPNPGAAVGATVLVLLWSGVVWFLVTVKAPILFPVVFGLVDLVLLGIVLYLWLGTSTITHDGGTLRVRNSVLGIGVTQAVPCADVVAVDSPITMQTGGGSGTPYYSVRFRCRDGRTVEARFEIRDKQEVEWLIAELRRAVGLPQGSAAPAR